MARKIDERAKDPDAKRPEAQGSATRPRPVSGAHAAAPTRARVAGTRPDSEKLESALYRIAEKANSAEDLQELFSFIHQVLGELMYARNCFIALADQNHQMIHFPYWVDEKDPAPTPTGHRSRRFGRGLTEYILRSNQPLLLDAIALQRLIDRKEVDLIGAFSNDWMGVPLKKGEQVFGVLVLQSYDALHHYGEQEKEILTFVSHEIASAIDYRRKRDALQDAEERYRNIFESVAEGIFQTTIEGHWVTANPSLARILGYGSPAELMRSLDVTTLYVDPVRRASFARALAETNELIAAESQVYRKDGTIIWVTENVRAVHDPAGKLCGFVGTVQDITARKRTEDALRESQALQSAMFRIAETAAMSEDLQQMYASIHQIIGELMYAPNFYIALYDAAADLISFPYYIDETEQPPASRKPSRGLTEYVLTTGQPFLSRLENLEDLVTDGAVKRIGAPSFDWMGVPLKKGETTFGVLAVQTYDEKIRYSDPDKELLTFVSQHVANAVQRRRDQEALKRSEERYRSLFERNMAGVFRSALDGEMLECNEAFAKMFGYERDELLGLPSHVLYPGGAEERAARIREFRSAGQMSNYETTYRRKDGRMVRAIQNVAIVKDESGNDVTEGTVVDVTERHNLEEQLRQSQKMEAVGRLAGGVAHDFNNLLTVIKGYSELLLDGYGEADPRRAEVEEIRKAADRAGALTRQLLAFSRQQVLAPKTLNLNQVVQSMDALLRRLLGESIELSALLGEGVGQVRADPGQLEQVVMNLAINARDAMPRGGKLTLGTANAEIDELYAREHPTITPGRYVLLAVSDSGVGMDADTQAHIFEPFFTTKEQGKGTGLGLSTVYGIVKQSGGDIWVYSEIGVGTTFKVYLPRVDAPAEAVPGRAVPVAHREGGTETVLVVEDEAGVRALVRKFLERSGYRVLEAASGDQALAMAEKERGKIHLLLTDVVLPRMSGSELSKRLVQARPEMRVLYMSGYTDDAIVHHGVLSAGAAFVQKPFTADSLARKIREILD
ncbi:MAG: PAS domain S-box protein [Candidatus Koribacter versatilis]|uniref:histidine kinase n=1 Tax=Candidatus Korobacter versatilis TaxID=658062 RepID=A0A932EPQ1_9BACT|nr:PAS domain S-box protein [Candidatus Koribacter versatilis]